MKKLLLFLFITFSFLFLIGCDMATLPQDEIIGNENICIVIINNPYADTEDEGISHFYIVPRQDAEKADYECFDAEDVYEVRLYNGGTLRVIYDGPDDPEPSSIWFSNYYAFYWDLG